MPKTAQQLWVQKAQEVFRTYPNVVFCGDFNFCSYRNYHGSGPLENDSLQNILPDFIDLWPEKYPHLRGYTFDSTVNRVINHYEQMRYDRIMYKSSNGYLRAEDIGLQGNTSASAMGIQPTLKEETEAVIAEEPIVTDGYTTPPKRTRPPKLHLKEPDGYTASELERIYPSDHFALFAVFDVQIED